HHGMIGALEAVLDRHVSRSEVDQSAGNEEGRYLARSALLEQQRGIGDAGETTDAGADHRSGGATLLLGRGVPVGIVERLTRRAHGKDDEVVDLALVLRLHPLIGVERAVAAVAARNDAGDTAGEVGDVKGVDFPGAALAVEDAPPGRLDAAAEWRHHAEARDDNPPHIQHSGSGPQQEAGGPLARGPSGFVSAACGRQLFAFFSRNFVASPTVKIVSAASSGISQPNSSSNAITNSTVSRLSAPRSSMKLALSTTFSGSTPRCSTTIFLTRSPISLIVQPRACFLDPTPGRYEPSWSLNFLRKSRINLIWPRYQRPVFRSP